jgi:quinol monooxygenase YgiN
MKTAIWKVTLKEGQRDAFINSYDVFKEASGFISCQFYPLKEDENTLFAVETWESDEAHKAYMQNISPETMAALFSKIDGRPEAYDCEMGKSIAR